MRFGSASLVGLAALLLVPNAAAYSLDGVVRTPQPLMVSGALAAEPPNSTLFLRPLADAPAGHVLVRADRAQIDVARAYATGLPVDGPQVTHDVRDLTNVSLVLETLDGVADVFAATRAQGGLAVQAARCGVRENLESPFATTDLPTQGLPLVGVSNWNGFWGNQLHADCRVGGVRATNVDAVQFYGMRLLLISNELTKVVRTGTFREPVVDGSPVMTPVRQSLNVYHLPGASISYDLPWEARAHFYASAFVATGELRVPPGEGRLAWGDLVREGNLRGLEAVGAFRIAWASQHYTRVSGTTLNGPPVEALVAPSPPAPEGLTVPLVALAAAGAGVLGLLLRLSWPLFTKLLPDRALEHPRRAQIVDYVRVQPGAEASRVARDLGIKWSSALYHIAALEQTRHLEVRRVDGRTALFLPDPALRGREEQIALQRRPTFQRLLEALRVQPGLDQQSLGARLQVGQSRVSKALTRLERANLVRRERTGRRTQYFAVAEVTAASPRDPPAVPSSV